MPPKRPQEEVLFALEVKRVGGHHHMSSRATPRARFWIVVGLIVSLGDSGVGLLARLAEAATWVGDLAGRVP